MADSDFRTISEHVVLVEGQRDRLVVAVNSLQDDLRRVTADRDELWAEIVRLHTVIDGLDADDMDLCACHDCQCHTRPWR